MKGTVLPVLHAGSNVESLKSRTCVQGTCAWCSAGILHHLIDILEPQEDFSAGHFHDLAHAAVRDILSRGHLPIVVGGTGFYLRMFIFGKPQGGSASKDEEARVAELLAAARHCAATAAGVSPAELDEHQEWEAGISVLSDLGDEEAAKRCAACAIALCIIVYDELAFVHGSNRRATSTHALLHCASWTFICIQQDEEQMLVSAKSLCSLHV